jgi:hypothetical protein
MKNYEPYNDDRNELMYAATKLMLAMAAVVPYVGLAWAGGIVISYMLSEPFNFTCKSQRVEVQSQYAKRRSKSESQEAPVLPTNAKATIQYLEPKTQTQE